MSKPIVIKPGTIEAMVALTTCGFDYGPSNEDVARIMRGVLSSIAGDGGSDFIGGGEDGPHLGGDGP